MSQIPNNSKNEVILGEKTETSGLFGVNKKRLIALAFALLFFAAGAVRFLSFDRFYPFVDYTDEAVYVGWAQDWRGISDESSLMELYGNMPPAYVWFNYLVQVVHDSIKGHNYNIQAEYYPILRFAAAIMGLLTTIFIAGTAWQIADWRAGFFAGMIWGLSPLVVRYNTLAIPDPGVYLFVSLSLFTAMLAWKRQSLRWLFLSLLSGIMVIYLKYWIVTAIVPFLIVGLAFLINGRLRQNWLWLLTLAGVSLSSAAYIIFVENPTANKVKLTNYDLTDLLLRASDFSRLTNNFEKAIIPIGTILFVATLILAFLAWVISFRNAWKRLDSKLFWLLLIFILLGLPLSSIISNVTADARIRHILPIAVAIYMLWGIGISQIMMTLDSWYKQKSQPFLRFANPLLAALLLIILLPNYIETNVRIVRNFQRERVVNVLSRWSDDNLVADGLVMHLSIPSDLDRVWNRLWGAYTGDNPFVWWAESADTVINTSPEDYVTRNIYYFIIDEATFDDLPPAVETNLRDYLASNLFLIKTFRTEENKLAGTDSYFYRMFPPQHEVEFTFGDTIHLTGYDISSESLQAGETLYFRPYWMSSARAEFNYSMFIQLHTSDDLSPIAQIDAAPASPERPTSTWDDETEVYIGRYQELQIPADIPSGNYILSIGLYNYETGVRLVTSTGDTVDVEISIGD